MNPWNFLWITVLLSELFTFSINALQSYLRWGFISYELIEIGAIDALFVPVIITPVIIYFIRKMEEIKGKNEQLLEEIDERSKLEEELRKEKTFIENALNVLNDAFFVIDLRGNMLRWNKTLRIVSGYSDEEISLMKPSDFFPAEEKRDVIQAIATVVKRGYDVLETMILTKDGRTIPFKFSGSLLKDAEGKVIGISGTGTDISQRKQAEKEIEELARFPEENPSPVFRISRDGIIEYVNEAGMPLLKLWDCDIGSNVCAEILDVVMNVLETASRKELEVMCEGKIYSLSFTPVKAAQYMNVYGSDITMRKLSEEAVRESEQRFRQIAEQIQEVFWIASSDFREMIYISPAYEKIWGLARENLHLNAKEWIEAVHPDDLQRVIDSLSRAGNKEMSIEYRVVRPDGSVRWIRNRGFPVRDEAGRAYRVAGIAQDITERYLDQQRIERQLQFLRSQRDIDMTIISSLDVRVTIKIILDEVLRQLSVDAADILLFNRLTHTLDYAESRGFRGNALKHTHLKQGEGYAGRAVIEKRTVRILDLSKEDAFKQSPLLAHEEFVEYFGVPLSARGRVNGVLEIFNRSSKEQDQEWTDFLETFGLQAAIAIDNAEMFRELERSNTDLALAYDLTLEGWSKALDYRDKETEGHSQRVTSLAVEMARCMGMDDKDLVHMRRGALLHDIGKLGVPDSILLKPDKLTDEEWKIMKKHPTIAYEILSPISFLKQALDIPYCHHEKWDGSGYPRGLRGEQIPLAARIFAVVDVWDALRSERPYRPAWPEEKAVAYILQQAGTYFDPEVIKICKHLLREDKTDLGAVTTTAES